MRGKEKGRRTHKVKSGITPAYAGKSAYLSPEDTAGRDHPRVCGEKYSWEKSTCKIFGSPPRMRGKGQKGLIFVLQPRITPAYAGKRLLRQLRHITSRDHPRVCGEKVGPVGCVSGWLGSPPRMRGKVTGSARAPLNARITPAYAGKSLTIQKMTTRSRDHPRVCGEKARRRARTHARIGSPPRMRGKGSKGIKKPDISGITPAYAGKSSALCLG